MENNLFRRGIIFAVTVIVSILCLLPTAFRGTFDKWITKPISLGLDLSGGVHLVYQVDAPEAVKSKLGAVASSIRSDLRAEKIAVTRAALDDQGRLEVTLLSARLKDQAKQKVQENFRDLVFVSEVPSGDQLKLLYSVSDDYRAKI